MNFPTSEDVLKLPHQRLPKGACDCHFHIHEEFAKYPLDNSRNYTPEPAPLQKYQLMCDTYGIERGVLVHPSVYGADHTSYEALLVANSAWLRGVAVVGRDTTDAQIARWNELGTRGTRINVPFSAEPSAEDIDVILDKIQPYGWHVQIFADLTRFPNLIPRITDRGAMVVVDHIGHGVPGNLIKSVGFASLLALMRDGRAWVKLSAPYRSSVIAPTYPEVRELVNAVLEANPAQAVWGTDWPHSMVTGPMPDDRDLVDLVFDWLPDPASRKAVLVDNATRLYWSDMP